jgi:hypothetical protein
VTNKWVLNASSRVPSPTWEDYAERYASVLRSIQHELHGEVTWWDPAGDQTTRLDPTDTKRLTELLVDNQIRNDGGALMAGAGSNQWLGGQRDTPQGEVSLLLHGGWGRREVSVYVALEVHEPEGSSLWSYADSDIARLVAGLMAAIGGSDAQIGEHVLSMLLARADAPFGIGSHVYMPVPLDDPSRFPPGARQVRCGEGWLLIVPPGATDEETLQRMQWVAAAVGVSG